MNRTFVSDRRHRVKVIERPGRALSRWTVTDCYFARPAGMDVEQRRVHLDRWYGVQLRAAIPALIAKWEPVNPAVRAALSPGTAPNVYKPARRGRAGRPRLMNRSPPHELRSGEQVDGQRHDLTRADFG